MNSFQKMHKRIKATPPKSAEDGSVVVFAAPGEGREAVEIARRILEEAARGVRFDEIAVLLRSPQTYLSVLEHALDRAGVPAWYHRGTRRPDPSGRALLAVLTCAEEELSARRFAEYVSLGQVPSDGVGSRESGVGSRTNTVPEAWEPALDEIVDAIVAPRDRIEDVPGLVDRIIVGRVGETDDVAACVAFLCSDHASYITGEVIDVTGGYHID